MSNNVSCKKKGDTTSEMDSDDAEDDHDKIENFEL